MKNYELIHGECFLKFNYCYIQTRFSHNNHYIIIKRSVIEEENEKVYDFSLLKIQLLLYTN